MLWTVGEEYLTSQENKSVLSFEQFESLTGKKLNWEARKEKKICTIRIKGHLKLYDTEFIAGESYKCHFKTYKCEHVDKTGLALLTPRGSALKAITARDTLDWEIE